VKLLVAGLGSIGRRHVRNLVTLGEDDILLYRTNQGTLPDLGEFDFPVFHDLKAALAQQPDAVIISNPTALHLDVAIPAAQAGCSLFLEKPVSHSLAQRQQLETALAQGGGDVLVGYQFRFHPGLQQTRALLADGAIGRPLSCRAVYGEYLPAMHPWEDYRRSYSTRPELGGGVILTLCHPLDTLRWLLGEVEAVWAFTGTLNPFDLTVEDNAEIGLRFANHVIGSVHLDYNRRPASHCLEITGSEGTLRWDNQDGIVWLYTAQTNAWQPQAAPLNFRGDGPFERNDMFLAEMSHFIAMLHGRESTCCDLQDGYRSLKLALAALASAQDQQIQILI
jgi:predicted dehydrogenase